MSAARLDLPLRVIRRSWRYYVYHLLSLCLGIVYFTVLVTLISLGAVLIIFWFGLAILLVTIGVSWYFARIERGVTVALLDADIPPLATPEARDNSTFQRLKTHLSSWLTWKSMFLLLIKLFYAVLAVGVVTALLGLVLDGLSAPFIYWMSGYDGYFFVDLWPVTSFAGASLKFLAVLPLLALAFALNDIFAWLWRVVAEYMLAPSAQRMKVTEVAGAVSVPLVSAGPSQLSNSAPESQVKLAEDLTAREVEVLGLLAEGLSNREIADTLYVTEGTIKRHTHNLYRKLGATNRVQAAAIGRQAGLVSDSTR